MEMQKACFLTRMRGENPNDMHPTLSHVRGTTLVLTARQGCSLHCYQFDTDKMAQGNEGRDGLGVSQWSLHESSCQRVMQGAAAGVPALKMKLLHMVLLTKKGSNERHL